MSFCYYSELIVIVMFVENKSANDGHKSTFMMNGSIIVMMDLIS